MLTDLTDTLQPCPRCAEPVPTAAQVCRYCSLDLTPPTVSAPTAPPESSSDGPTTAEQGPATTSEGGRRWGIRELLIVALVAVTLTGAGFLFASSRTAPLATVPSPTLTPVVVDLPPNGVIWFGSSFDATTFAIKAKTFRVNINTPFSMVASLTHGEKGANLLLRLSLDGGLAEPQPLKATGFAEVWGFTLDALPAGGTWTYDLVDIGGDVLASGTIQAA